MTRWTWGEGCFYNKNLETRFALISILNLKGWDFNWWITIQFLEASTDVHLKSPPPKVCYIFVFCLLSDYTCTSIKTPVCLVSCGVHLSPLDQLLACTDAWLQIYIYIWSFPRALRVGIRLQLSVVLVYHPNLKATSHATCLKVHLWSLLWQVVIFIEICCFLLL